MLTAKRIPFETGKPENAPAPKTKGKGARVQQKTEAPVMLFKSFAKFIHFLRTGKNLTKNVKLMPSYSIELNQVQAIEAYKRIKALRTVKGVRFATKKELILAAVSEGVWILVITFGKPEKGRYILSVELRHKQTVREGGNNHVSNVG